MIAVKNKGTIKTSTVKIEVAKNFILVVEVVFINARMEETTA